MLLRCLILFVISIDPCNSEPAKKKTGVKDHAAANRAMLRAVAAENRAVAADAAEEANREAFKMNRFKGVESVVFKDNPTREKVHYIIPLPSIL